MVQDFTGSPVSRFFHSSQSPATVSAGAFRSPGHSLKTVHQILERYLARTRGLAEQFEKSPRTKFANQLQTGGGGGTNANEKDVEGQ
jgi:hypothetical protein